MKKKVTLKISGSLLLDAIAILFIVFLSDISSLIGWPLYNLDPMRMMVILAIAFTPRWNGWALALLLPLASYFLGSHPAITKAILMAAELLLNVWLFWYLFDKTKSSILAVLVSIVFSKAVYYIMKYYCIEMGWLGGDIMSTSLNMQVITTLSFTLFIFIVFLLNGKPSKR
jgi:hypothetical protein